MKTTIKPNEQRILINHAKKHFVPGDTLSQETGNSGSISIECFCLEEEKNEFIYVFAASRFGVEMWRINAIEAGAKWTLVENFKGRQ